MTCLQAVMEQETTYLSTLGKVAVFQEDGSQLFVFDLSGIELAGFSNLVPTSLTDINWIATAITDGSGGLTSPVTGSTIVANFTTNSNLFGETGCNQYSTSYQIQGKRRIAIQAPAAPPPVEATPPPPSSSGGCALVSQSPADGTAITIGTSFNTTWVLQNTGTSNWAVGEYDISFYRGI